MRNFTKWVANRLSYKTLFMTILATLFLSGCGYRYVEVQHPENFSSPRLTDPNSDIYEKMQITPGKITLAKPCRVNYRKDSWRDDKNVAVNATLSNGKEYMVYIDSGMGLGEINVNDLIVQENNLETACFKPPVQRERYWAGVCFLPSLKIGEMVVKEPLCTYHPWHLEYRVLGIPVVKYNCLILGVPMMAQFRYVRFDNATTQLELSYNQSFQQEDSVKWTSYPFVLKNEGRTGRTVRIKVDIPIQGQTCNLLFDTCGSRLVMTSAMWEKIRNRITVTTSKDNKFISYQKGILPCRRVTAKTLSVGPVTTQDAEIVILPEDSQYLRGSGEGFIAMDSFKDTSVVLDFEHKLMWVKKH